MTSTSPDAMHDTPQGNSPDEPARITQLVLGMVRSLVDDPESIQIETESDAGNTTLRLYVKAADLGKVIGKQGRTARSLRTILSAIGSKSGHRYTLDVLEAE